MQYLPSIWWGRKRYVRTLLKFPVFFVVSHGWFML